MENREAACFIAELPGNLPIFPRLAGHPHFIDIAAKIGIGLPGLKKIYHFP